MLTSLLIKTYIIIMPECHLWSPGLTRDVQIAKKPLDIQMKRMYDSKVKADVHNVSAEFIVSGLGKFYGCTE